MALNISNDTKQLMRSVFSSGSPVIFIESWEEERVEDILNGMAAEEGALPVWRWSLSAGFLSGPGVGLNLQAPELALAFVLASDQPAIWLFRDLPALLEAPHLKRILRDIYDVFSGSRSLLVSCQPRIAIADDLRKEIYYLRLPLPDRLEIQSYLTALNQTRPAEVQFSNEWLTIWAAEMSSLTLNECRALFHSISSANNNMAEAKDSIRRMRAQTLIKESCLQVIETDLNLDSVGGLVHLKKWVMSRKELFGLSAQEAGISPPSGVLMMGVSGCGKSMSAKVIAATWQLPLVRLDMNLVMSGAWASPELAWARALESIETIAPVVVWLDEIEDSFGYANGQVANGNFTIFSSFLTWMQEKAKGVFVVATANNIEMLPAEMLRKGRFDELFFLDLPKKGARIEILGIHIRKQGGELSNFDLDELADFVDGWTAAEIEQLVKAARLQAFYEKRDFCFAHVKDISFKMVPLSKTMAEQINELRRWSRSRAVSAD